MLNINNKLYNKIVNKGLILCFALLMLNQLAQSQVKQPKSKKASPKVELIARSFGDSIVLRWAPNSPSLWQFGNKYGYIVERLTVGYDDEFFTDKPQIQLLTDNPIRPLPLNQIEPLAMKDNNAAIVAQAIYGETFQVTNNVNNNVASFFNQARDFQNRFSFSLFAADQSIIAAKAHGLVFTDKNIDPHERYQYRVYLASSSNMIMSADTGKVYVNPQEIFEVPKPIDVEARFGDGLVELSWNRKYFEKIFSTYFIERSEDNGKTFKRINNLPYINTTKSKGYLPEKMYITDSLPQNDKKIVYRVKGITPFGEVSPPSDTVSGKGRTTIPYINPIIVKNELINEDQIKITWEVVEENASSIKGFKVYKAHKDKGPFVLISEEDLPSSSRTFTDTIPYGTNYYKVAAIDKYKNLHQSFPSLAQIPDTIPPTPPINLKGIIDTAGIVTIEWDKNTEPDLMGYNVFIANNPKAEFMRINHKVATQNIYYDTTIVKTLSKYVYYKVTALDKRYNESELSVVLKLERPDMVPPATANFTGWSVADSGISLQWMKSYSEDAEQYLVYRKHHKDEWTLIGIIDTLKENYSFTDTAVKIGKTYDYLLVVVDKSGLESSPSKIVSVRMHSNGLAPSITRFYGKADHEEKTIELAWDYPNIEEVERFLIFRAPEEEAIRLYRSVNDGSNTFTDKGLTKGKKYSYRVQALLKNGMQSAISEVLIIKY